MAASTSALAPSNSTSVLFRAWASAISAALLAAGWVKTSDTGQIDLTTVSAPGSINTSAGYEIWRTNDTGTGFQAWYLKIEYGSGGATSTPSIWYTIGTGSNGSGTLTGQLSTRTQLPSAFNTTTTYSCFFGGGTSWFSMCLWSQTSSSTNYSVVLLLERIKDNSGNDTDIGMTTVTFCNGSVCGHQSVPKTGTIWSRDAFIPCAAVRPSSLTSGLNTGLIPVFPWIHSHYPAVLGLMGFYYSDISNATSFSVSRYGTSRTYIACQLTSSGGTPSFLYGTNGLASQAFACLMRYE